MKAQLTTLRGSKVFSGSRRAGSGTARLLDTESAAFVLLTLQSLLGSIGLIRGDHLDKSKTTTLLGMRIAHDLTLLDLTVLLEEARNLGLGQTGVDASDK